MGALNRDADSEPNKSVVRSVVTRTPTPAELMKVTPARLRRTSW